MDPGHLQGVGAVPTGGLSLPSDRGASTGTRQCQLPAISSTVSQTGATMLDRNTGASSALSHLVRGEQGLDSRPGGCSELFPQEQRQQEPPYGMRQGATLPWPC